jgi:hypothetical protein
MAEPSLISSEYRVQLTNIDFGTTPLVVHAHGHHAIKPHWQPIRDAFFASAPARVVQPQQLTIITCNNGHATMGLLERSLDHLGLRYAVGGQGIAPWINARDKPPTIYALLDKVGTEFVLYADSRDAILLDDPAPLVERFRTHFTAELVFSADRMHWPPVPRFKRFERALAAHEPGDFHYLNGGVWMGKTSFCREFFARALSTPAVPEAPDSEQGILRELLREFHPRIALDHRCRLFQNIGFLTAPVLRIDRLNRNTHPK